MLVSTSMGAFEIIEATLDSCIDEARNMFTREQSTLARSAGGSAEYAHSERVKNQECLACKRENVEYTVVGIWAEKAEEKGNVTWDCYVKGNIMVKGPRTIVVARLKALSKPPKTPEQPAA